MNRSRSSRQARKRNSYKVGWLNKQVAALNDRTSLQAKTTFKGETKPSYRRNEYILQKRLNQQARKHGRPYVISERTEPIF